MTTLSHGAADPPLSDLVKVLGTQFAAMNSRSGGDGRPSILTLVGETESQSEKQIKQRANDR